MWPKIDINQFKLIIFDVDGTLLAFKQELAPFTLSVLNDVQALGIPVTLATGKNLKATQPLAEKLGIEMPMIFSNGSVIQRLDGTIHEKFTLPEGFVDVLIEECEAMGIDLAIHIEEEVYVREITHNLSLLIDYGIPSLVEVGDWSTIKPLLLEAYKCLVIDRTSRAPLLELERRLRRRVGASIACCHSLTEMIEFMPKDVSKLSGLRIISKMMGIQLESVMAFGDGNNDAEMLAAAGFSGAVENGVESVKKSADLVVPACADNGPAQFLDFLMQK